MLVIFLLGFFLDFIEIADCCSNCCSILLADPSANITAVWLGVMIGLNIQTSFLTPPFGFALFYLRELRRKLLKRSKCTRRDTLIALQLVGLAIVGVNPSLVNYLPTKTFLSSETAPPPKNPRLQLCLEDYLFDFYNSNENSFLEQVVLLRQVDYSSLPKSQEKSCSEVLIMLNKFSKKLTLLRRQKKRLLRQHPNMHQYYHKFERLNDS